MPGGSRFRLEKDRLYHFPHNSAIYEEFDAMLRALDPEKTGQSTYTFKEICRIMLIDQVKSGKFKDFHSRPYDIFTKPSPPDLNTLYEKAGRYRARKIAEERKEAWRKFLRNPDRNYEGFVDVRYKPTKTWRQNWVEFVRDYADMAAYCGLLPCYYKNLNSDSEEDGYVLSDRGRAYLKGRVRPEFVMMGMKYANSSISLMRWTQFNIQVRPFYAALRLLVELDNRGVKLIDKKLLGAAVGCLRTEDEIPEAAELIKSEFSSPIASFSRQPRTPPDFVKEGERFSLSLVSFLARWKMAEIKEGRTSLVRVTDFGREVVGRTPRYAFFYNSLLGHIKPTLLIGHLLYVFCSTVMGGNDQLDYAALVGQLKAVVDMNEVDDALAIIKDQLDPSPIKAISHGSIQLNPVSHQYAITPASDFSSSAEAAFVERGVGAIAIKAPPAVQVAPPKAVLARLQTVANGSNGSEYEDVLVEALKDLKTGKVVPLGHKVAGQRYTDIVWEVPIIESIVGSEKEILVIIEAKSGDAIRAFDERAAMDDIVNTLKDKYSKRLHNVAGIWIWVVDSSNLPSVNGSHGGAREGSKTFREKMNELLQLTSYAKTLVVVTAMSVESFVEYYSYLFGSLPQQKPPLTEVTSQNFWIWGKAFRPLSGYVFIYDDPMELRRRLLG